MIVALVTCTYQPEFVAGMAAAACTRNTNYESALGHAMAGGHEAVIEHVVFTFKIMGVSRALLAQLTRHRIASYSVESQRYCDMADFKFVLPQSIQEDPEAMRAYIDHMEKASELYQKLVECGVPKEDARYVTPQAATTTIVMTMNARELRHFFALRCCNRAQWEIRALADEMMRICRRNAPVIFQDAGPECLRTGCPEERPCEHPRDPGEWD